MSWHRVLLLQALLWVVYQGAAAVLAGPPPQRHLLSRLLALPAVFLAFDLVFWLACKVSPRSISRNGLIWISLTTALVVLVFTPTYALGARG